MRGIVQVGKRARDVGKKVRKESNQGGPPKVTVSVSTHVPKPHTPFQWCAMDATRAVIEKQGWLREEVKNTGVDLRMHDCDTSWLEGVFARGDRKLGRVLERAYHAARASTRGKTSMRMHVWEEAFERGNRPGPIPRHDPGRRRAFPGITSTSGSKTAFSSREYRKALKDRLSLPCGKVAGAFIHETNIEDAEADERKLVCYDCGVACDLGDAHRATRLAQARR